MRQKKELKQLAAQTFPAKQYSLRERIICRKNLYHAMLSYQCEHPDASFEDIRQMFCDVDLDIKDSSYIQIKKSTLFFLCLALIIIICIVLISIASTWKCPTIRL